MAERLVTVSLLYGGRLTIPCPEWCEGHTDPHPAYPEDVRHEQATTDLTVATTRGDVGILGYSIAQAPYSQVSPLPWATVDLDTEGAVSVTPDQIRDLADGLEGHAVQLRGFATWVEETIAQAAAQMRPERMPAGLPWPPADEDGAE